MRDRPDDIPILVEHFSTQVRDLNGWTAKRFRDDALAALAAYAWPGNVRELHNIVERLLLLADTEVRHEDVQAVLEKGHGHPADGGGVWTHGSLAERVLAFERQVMLSELRQHNYRIAETARTLGLERSHLYKKCEQLGIDLKQERRNAEDADGG